MCEAYATTLSIYEPLTNSIWKQAMMDEYQALMKNNTWELLLATHNKYIVSTKWVTICIGPVFQCGPYFVNVRSHFFNTGHNLST